MICNPSKSILTGFANISANVSLPSLNFLSYILLEAATLPHLLKMFVVCYISGLNSSARKSQREHLKEMFFPTNSTFIVFKTDNTKSKHDCTIWVSAHLIGNPSKAPFILKLLWQARTFENPPLQPCESTDVACLIFGLAQWPHIWSLWADTVTVSHQHSLLRGLSVIHHRVSLELFVKQEDLKVHPTNKKNMFIFCYLLFSIWKEGE